MQEISRFYFCELFQMNRSRDMTDSLEMVFATIYLMNKEHN
jgi:hypothetical protein